MLKAYVNLHGLGYAHSVEIGSGKLPADGVSLGKCFRRIDVSFEVMRQKSLWQLVETKELIFTSSTRR
jgi:Leu/Phe-tRNA-protein transferase